MIHAEQGRHAGRRLQAGINYLPRMRDLFGGQLAWPADVLPSSLRRSHAGIHPLDDQRPLELGQRTKKVEDQLAAGYRRIDRFRE